MGTIDGNNPKDKGLLIPAGVVIVTVTGPTVAVPGTLNVAVADVEFATFRSPTLMSVPAFTVAGVLKRLPVSVTPIDVTGTPNGGNKLIRAGRTLIEIV